LRPQCPPFFFLALLVWCEGIIEYPLGFLGIRVEERLYSRHQLLDFIRRHRRARLPREANFAESIDQNRDQDDYSENPRQ
jgi:hypothetical protein